MWELHSISHRACKVGKVAQQIPFSTTRSLVRHQFGSILSCRDTGTVSCTILAILMESCQPLEPADGSNHLNGRSLQRGSLGQLTVKSPVTLSPTPTTSTSRLFTAWGTWLLSGNARTHNLWFLSSSMARTSSPTDDALSCKLAYQLLI